MLINYIEDTIADYCNWESDYYSLEMNLIHLDKEFNFKYYYDKKSNKLVRELYIDKEFYKNKDVTEILAEYFDPALCNSSIISFQGRVDLIDTTPAKRREGLKKIYNLDFSSQIKKAEFKIKDLTDKDLFDLKNNIFSMVNKDYNLNEIVSLPFSEEKRQELEIKLNSLEEKVKNYQLSLEKYTKINIEIKEIEKKIENINKIIYTQNNDLLELSNKKQQLVDNYSNMNWETELKRLERELTDIEFTRPLKNNQLEIDKLKIEIQNLKFELKQVQSNLTASENGLCPECKRPFSSKEKNTYQEDVDNFTKRIQEKNKDLKILEDLQIKYNEIINDNKVKENKVTLLKSKIDSEKVNIENNKKVYQKDIDIKKSEIQNKQLLIEQNNLNLKAYQEKLKSLQEDLPGEKPNIKESIYVEISDIKIKIENYNNILIENNVKEEQNKKIEKQKKEDKILLANYLSKQKTVQKEIDTLKRFKIILQKEFPNYVIDQMVGSIEEGMNNIVDMIYEGRYKVKIVKTKAGIDVVYGKNDASIKVASGFEKELFNLGYKHAFSSISNLGILILDEIDSYADETNSEKLFETMGELKNLYNQIFIVTHKPNIQEILIQDHEALCYVMDKGKAEIF